ncbi:MAG TPA: endolytic transglycosylase MltG, partial [Clostridiales bacterium]|nr:endolytic transglycosylase MltG [Clostridiales bacterium]
GGGGGGAPSPPPPPPAGPPPRRTQEIFTAERVARAASLGMTPFEVLTLASIIEKEAVVDEERPLISSVYHNRLKAGMMLNACPTVFYFLGKPMSERLLIADLEVDSPYNTYRNVGLPPGPICSPGLASIDAALYPAETSYYYFVSKNDGTHHFSRTLAEHNRAVAEYQGG